MIEVAIDIETKDPNLKDFGDGAIRKDGRILGVGIYCESNPKFNGYWPPDSQLVKDVMANKDIIKIFHNAVYDLTWINNGYNIPFNGCIEDTMTRETLLDAYSNSYKLDAICKRRGLEGKNSEDTIEIWWKGHGGKGKAVEHLDEIPEPIVRKYNEQDLRATYELYKIQQPLLEKEDLLYANDIECRLYPLLMQMKRNGIRIDSKAQQELSDKLNTEYNMLMANMQKKYPFFDSLTAPTQLKQIWLQEGIPFTYTDKGNVSFASEVLELTDHPVAEQIIHMRTLNSAITKYVDGALMDYKIRGRIHGTFYPALRDEGGTITGRFSCRDPGLQTISAREGKFGKEIRGLFIPEEDHLLLAFDYKQIEYKTFLNYATGPGAEEARKKFIENPDTDYHQMVVDMMGWASLMGEKEARHHAKNFNFGSIYGLGVRSFAQKFRKDLLPMAMSRGITVEQLASNLMEDYFDKATFVRPTMRAIQNKGKSRGYIRTFAGRRQRMPLDGGAYKLVNYLCQGGASDILKKGLVDSWDSGVFETLKMHLTIHDENVASMPLTSEGVEAAIEFGRCMESAYRLHLPLSIDREAGLNWGNCTYGNYKKYFSGIAS